MHMLVNSGVSPDCCRLIDNRYIFQQIAHEPTKFKIEFAAYIGEMYPVRLCLHVLPDASLHVCRRFLVGPVSECLEAFGFF